MKEGYVSKLACVILLLKETTTGQITCEDAKVPKSVVDDMIVAFGGRERVLGLLGMNYVKLEHDNARIAFCHERNKGNSGKLKCRGCKYCEECR